MPSKFIPIKSGAHRLACLSLYRALLRQCIRFPPSPSSGHSNPQPRSTLQSLVRFRFRKDRRFINGTQIQDALKFGRDALQLLENAAAGSTAALQHLSQTLSSSASLISRNARSLADKQAEQNTSRLAPKFAKRKARAVQRADTSNYKPKPTTVPVLERPVPYEQALKDENGRRRVPTYMAVNGIPFLRYGRKQPLALTQYILPQMRLHQRNFDRRLRMAEALAVALQEDKWDQIVDRSLGVQQEDSVEPFDENPETWASAYKDALRQDEHRQRVLGRKRVEHGRKLLEVLEKEKCLAAQEEEERKAGSRERRDVRDSSDPDSGVKDSS